VQRDVGESVGQLVDRQRMAGLVPAVRPGCEVDYGLGDDAEWKEVSSSPEAIPSPTMRSTNRVLPGFVVAIRHVQEPDSSGLLFDERADRRQIHSPNSGPRASSEAAGW